MQDRPRLRGVPPLNQIARQEAVLRVTKPNHKTIAVFLDALRQTRLNL
jgi:hypothetical protein